MGIAAKKNGYWTAYFIVARYRPAGNYVDVKYGYTYKESRLRSWIQNVPKPRPGNTNIYQIRFDKIFINELVAFENGNY